MDVDYILSGSEDDDTDDATAQEAARFAGINDGWKVVLWLPGPKMKLKVAGVLVDPRRDAANLDHAGRWFAAASVDLHRPQ